MHRKNGNKLGFALDFERLASFCLHPRNSLLVEKLRRRPVHVPPLGAHSNQLMSVRFACGVLARIFAQIAGPSVDDVHVLSTSCTVDAWVIRKGLPQLIVSVTS